MAAPVGVDVSRHMDAIAQLKRRLAEIPGVRYEETANSLKVPAVAPSGFEITLVGAQPRYEVYFEGWHDHFASSDEAIKWFMLGLSPRCRLKVTRRGGKAHIWTLEALDRNNWVSYGTTALLFFPFWRRAETVYLQNRIIGG